MLNCKCKPQGHVVGKFAIGQSYHNPKPVALQDQKNCSFVRFKSFPPLEAGITNLILPFLGLFDSLFLSFVHDSPRFCEMFLYLFLLLFYFLVLKLQMS